MTNYLPLISIATNILMVIIGTLLARWIGGVLQNFEAKIRIAILELKDELGDSFATKHDLERVEKQVKLGERMDGGFAQVIQILREQPRSRSRRAPEVVR